MRVSFSPVTAKKVSWPTLFPLQGCGSLTMAFTGKFVLTGNHFILLRLNPFELSVDREGWYFEHSMSSWQVLLSAEGGKTFPGPSYLHSKDRVE